MRMRHIVTYGLPQSTIFFPHYLINETIFEKKLLNAKCVFWFSVQFFFFWKISHSKQKWARYEQISILVFM